jgi:hypothetical protein
MEDMYEVVVELIRSERVAEEEEGAGEEGGRGGGEAAEVQEAGVVPPPMTKETMYQVQTIFEVYSDPSRVVENEAVVEEQSYLQFLRDTDLMKGEEEKEGKVGDEGEEGGGRVGRISRVEAIELFRINVSKKSSLLAPDNMGLCFEDFYTALHCIALITTRDVEEGEALQAMMGKALEGL